MARGESEVDASAEDVKNPEFFARKIIRQ